MALQSVIPDDITLLHKAYNLFVRAGGIVSVFSCRFVPGQNFRIKVCAAHAILAERSTFIDLKAISPF